MNLKINRAVKLKPGRDLAAAFILLANGPVFRHGRFKP
jgi:hypothetical protein